MNIIDFDKLFTKLVVEGMVTQVAVPFNDDNRNLQKGDICSISFDSIPFKDYLLQVCNVSVTSLGRLSNQDLFDEGFLYRPFFEEFMLERGIGVDDTVLKVDFKVVDRDGESNL